LEAVHALAQAATDRLAGLADPLPQRIARGLPSLGGSERIALLLAQRNVDAPTRAGRTGRSRRRDTPKAHRGDCQVGYFSHRVHSGNPAAASDPSGSPEELAKAWLVRVIERTPLEDVGDVELALLTSDAPPLIAEILKGLSEPVEGAEVDLRPETSERARGLRRLRRGDSAPTEIPRDLAALQSLLIESLRRDIPERRSGDFARSVERLAEIFGSIQATLTEGLVRERAGEPRRDELTGLPGQAELHEWLRILLAEQARYEHPFAIVLIDIEGL